VPAQDQEHSSVLEQALALDAQALFVSATGGLGLERLREWLFSEQTQAA